MKKEKKICSVMSKAMHYVECKRERCQWWNHGRGEDGDCGLKKV